ncbi:MAG: PDZ domain-containing protein [Bacteroidetes bacterium]|jgi:carboxyl-terminal processing protease|nr:PDZ domain-containing protein [Bacteroidota bacterium]
MSYKNPNKIVYLPIIIALSIIAGIFIGKLYQQGGEKQNGQFFIYPRTDKLSNVINYIESEYVDTVDKKELIEKTIPKLLSELDPHSVYIPAEDFKSVNESLEGNFSGIGVQFNMQNDTVIVVNTIPNGPSEKVGIMAGDRIVTVEDDTIAGVDMRSDEVVSRLKGPKGTKVTVGILRRDVDELLQFEITRDNIPLYSIDISYMLNDTTGYIKINKFAGTTFEEFMEAYKKLNQLGMKRLLIDLRGNGGGYLNAATKIADQFLNNNELIVYTRGRSRPRSEVRATPDGIAPDIPLGVILDESSASASEVLAGAVQDNDRAVIIGRRSFGKGLVQEQTKLSDGSAIRLTTARYYTPTGRSIQKPYENGKKDYYDDLTHRIEHGELLSADSIEFADSLIYRTPEGDTVYGGGGIMPDYFIPIDTMGATDYLSSVRNRGLVYRFAFEYTDNNRDKLSSFNAVQALEKYLDTQSLVKQFTDYTAKKGIVADQSQTDQSHRILHHQLKAYIARNIFDNEGFYPIIRDIDNTLQKAIDIIAHEQAH